jgi:hypothetical protein
MAKRSAVRQPAPGSPAHRGPAALWRKAGPVPRGAPGRRGNNRNWAPIAGYVLFVLVIGAGLFAWDQAYEARQRALFAPPPAPVLVRNLIEDVVGRGTVKDVKIDDKAGTLNVTVQDVLVKPGQSLTEKKKNLSTEGALAIQFVQSRVRYKVMSVHLVQDGKVLATVTVTGQGAPTTQYAPDLK